MPYRIVLEVGTEPRVDELCDVHLKMSVTKIEDSKETIAQGSLKLTKGEETLCEKELDEDGTLTHHFTVPLRDKSYQFKVDALFKASDGIKRGSTTISIPASSGDRKGRTERIKLILLDPTLVRISKEEFKAELAARFCKLVGEKEIGIPNAQVSFWMGREEIPDSTTTTDSTGMAFGESSTLTADEFEQTFRFLAKAKDRDDNVHVSKSLSVTIKPARPTGETPAYKLDLSARRIPLSDGKCQFALKATLTQSKDNGKGAPVQNHKVYMTATMYKHGGDAETFEVEAHSKTDERGQASGLTKVLSPGEDDQPIYFMAHCEFDGQEIVSNAWDDVIPGQPPKKTPPPDYRLTLSYIQQQKSADEFNFLVTGLLVKLEQREGEQSKHQVRVPGASVIFYLNDKPSAAIETDPTGQAFFGTEAITAGEFEKRVRLSAQTEVNGQIIGSNVEIGVVPAVVVAKRPTAEVADLIVRCRGNAAEVMAVDKDKNPVSAKLSIVPFKKDVSIRKPSGEEVKSAEPTDIPAGTSVFFFHHREKTDFMTTFATGAVTKTQRIYPQTL